MFQKQPCQNECLLSPKELWESLDTYEVACPLVSSSNGLDKSDVTGGCRGILTHERHCLD